MDLPPNLVDLLNAKRGGFDKLIGLTFTHAARDRVRAELELSEQHHQPYGLTHGGVLCAMIESCCSVGAAVAVMGKGLNTVGLENQTSFVRGTRTGRLEIEATPVRIGRRTQLWEATVRAQDHRVVATGRVRILCLEQGSAVAGEKVQLKV